MQEVILVNERDEETGTMEKMEAHRQALLHRAFSVFVFNEKGQMLLQRRAAVKYHSAGLWTNACCSHPFPGETTRAAASRRLFEELGFSTPIEEIFTFAYQAPFGNGLTENEYDHVFTGFYNGEIHPDPEEVSECVYKSMDEIKKELQTNGDAYTAWFHIAFPRVEKWLEERKKTPVH